MVNTIQIRITEDAYKYIEDHKMIPEENIYSVVNRIIDKAKTFDKRVKQ
jgi:hypothetical protein